MGVTRSAASIRRRRTRASPDLNRQGVGVRQRGGFCPLLFSLLFFRGGIRRADSRLVASTRAISRGEFTAFAGARRVGNQRTCLKNFQQYARRYSRSTSSGLKEADERTASCSSLDSMLARGHRTKRSVHGAVTRPGGKYSMLIGQEWGVPRPGGQNCASRRAARRGINRLSRIRVLKTPARWTPRNWIENRSRKGAKTSCARFAAQGDDPGPSSCTKNNGRPRVSIWLRGSSFR